MGNGRQQFRRADWFLDEVERAGFHGTHRHGHVAMSRDDDGRQIVPGCRQLLQQLQSIYAGHRGIHQQAGVPAGTARAKGGEKRVASRVVFDNPAVVFEHCTKCRANAPVIIYNKDKGCTGVPVLSGRALRRRLLRRGQQQLINRSDKFRWFHRLTKLDDSLRSHVLQGSCRDVAGKYDHRYVG